MATLETSSVGIVLEKMVKTIRAMHVRKGIRGADVIVDYAMGHTREMDEIQIGDIEEHEEIVVKMNSGRRKRDESYDVVINVWVTRSDIQDAIHDAEQHKGRILDWFSEHPDLDLGIPTLRVLETRSSLNMTMAQTGQGWQVHITIRPHIQVRLV